MVKFFITIFSKLNELMSKVFVYLYIFNFVIFIIKYINNSVFFISGLRDKTNFLNNFFVQLGDLYYKSRNLTKREEFDFSFTKEKDNVEDFDDFNSKEYFQDFSTNVPLYKMFFSINKGFFNAFELFYYLRNRILQPFSGFFETLYKKRVSSFRYNYYPRKKRKERMLNYNLIFLKRFFFLKMKIFFHFFSLFLFFFFFFKVKVIILSVIFTILICYNQITFLIIVKLFKKKFKKLKLGVKLIAFKNYNYNNELYLIKGIPPQVSIQKEYNLNVAVKDMSDFLENEIYKIFLIMTFQVSSLENENLNVRKLKYDSKFKFFLMITLLKKILTLGSFMPYLEVFKVLGFFNKEQDVASFLPKPDDVVVKSKQYTDKRIIYNYFLLFKNFADQLSPNNVDDDIEAIDAVAVQTKWNIKNVMIYPYINSIFEVIINNTLITIFLQIFKSIDLKNFLLKKILFLFNKKMRVIEYTTKNINQMLFLLELYNKKSFVINMFNLEFNFELKKNNYFNETFEFDSFLDSIFSTKQKNNFFGISSDKYLTLIKKEKEIFEIEKYLNDFDIFIERLLLSFVLNFSKEDKDKLILDNKRFFILEKYFKEILLKYHLNVNFDELTLYNDNLNEYILYLIHQNKTEDVDYNLCFRNKNIEENSFCYNITNFSKYGNEHKLLMDIIDGVDDLEENDMDFNAEFIKSFVLDLHEHQIAFKDVNVVKDFFSFSFGNSTKQPQEEKKK
jgi:hypothetical protein